MKSINLIRKSLVLGVLGLFVTTSIIPNTISMNNYPRYHDNVSISYTSVLDIEYIYNIIRDLSYIIFTEYNESAGEIAKGRSFGTKGEHRAAEILYENMTKLGLNTTMEQINNTPKYPELIYGYDVLDYKLNLKNKSNDYNETTDSWISAIKLDPPLVHEKIFNFTYEGLKIKQWPKTILDWIKALAYDKKEENYVFISDIEGGLSRNPDPNLPLDLILMRKFFYPIRLIPSIGHTYFRRHLEQLFLDKFFNNCRGKIAFDFTNDTHDTGCNADGNKIPTILINGTECRRIVNDIDNYTIDFFVKEMYNKSVVCYNVIGQLNGTDPSKTVIVDCLYDSVWCQGTGDAAIGMGIVMGIAKYFSDNEIVPKYNIKFIGFGGEEAGCRGAKYYEETHKDENIIYVIDMNQVCSSQEYPRLTLNVIFNNFRYMNEIWPIVERTNYTEKVGNTDITKRCWPEGAPSDEGIFARNRPFKVKTVCFLEDFPWLMHHRDGLNHTVGDVFDNVDWNEVSVTGELVLNITKYLTVDDVKNLLN